MSLLLAVAPAGWQLALKRPKLGLSHLILDMGSLTESIRQYPRRMRFFSTAENIEIGGLPFAISDVKAGRDEALQYYRKAAAYYHLNFELFKEVWAVRKEGDEFIVTTTADEHFRARKVIMATGYFTRPRWLNIPGENSAACISLLRRTVQILVYQCGHHGGSNSAVEAALELYRHDVNVTIVHRGDDFRSTVKYWLVPDVKNRVKEGRIKTAFNSAVTQINEKYSND